MKLLTLLLFCASVITVQSQNYELIDENVKNYPNYNEIHQLVLRVNNSFDTDTEKVRAFYIWITHNIAYDLETYYTLRAPRINLRITSDRYSYNIEDYQREQMAKKVFTERKAMCLGYSTLFTELCLKSGIEVRMIKGIVKTTFNDIDNLQLTKNHSWNAVKINEQWKLIDVTFSSGYENPNTGQWVNTINDFYFFTDPEILSYSHFPQEKDFQLVEKPLDLKTFYERPIFYNAYFESDVTLCNDQNGLLTISENDNKIRIKFSGKKKNSKIYYKFDDDLILKRLYLKKNDVANFQAVLKYKSETSKKLSLYYDNKIIIDFKIKT